jgi:hypothetical protein
MQFNFTKTHKSRPTVSMMDLNTRRRVAKKTKQLGGTLLTGLTKMEASRSTGFFSGSKVEAKSAATRGFVVSLWHSEQS